MRITQYTTTAAVFEETGAPIREALASTSQNTPTPLQQYEVVSAAKGSAHSADRRRQDRRRRPNEVDEDLRTGFDRRAGRPTATLLIKA